ncbi:MAG: FtsX-like permease family protein [Candidatus Micrarchaeaceae archaeon]|jgi:ABC-type antimicrobial peptide transport system permease subunit
MNIQDILWLSIKDLSEKKMRTALTVVMVVIGVAAIVALTSITAGVSHSISASLSTLGPTSIIVEAKAGVPLTSADTSTLSGLPNVTGVTPVVEGTANLYSGNQNVSVSIVGVSPSELGSIVGQNLSLYQGTVYQDTITPSVVIGHSVAFPTAVSSEQVINVGQTATLKLGGKGGRTVTVPIVGIFPSQTSFIVPINTGVFMSLSAAELLLQRTSFNYIIVTASNVSTVNSTANLISNIYGSSVDVITTSSILSTVASITGSLGLLFGAIAGVSLLVAAIGIMNVMLIAVYERTHEIGIMKSVGFKNRNVLMIFLFQALLIGIIGGVVGIGLGAGASYGLSAVLGHGSSTAAPTTSSSSSGASTRAGGASAFGGGGGGSSSAASSLSFSPVFPISTIVYALVIAVAVSVLAGIYPAWRASKMEPIDALRQL